MASVWGFASSEDYLNFSKFLLQKNTNFLNFIIMSLIDKNLTNQTKIFT